MFHEMKPAFEKLFGFDSSKHNVRTEILAGITTFLTMAYILAVNPAIFSALDGIWTACPAVRYLPQRPWRPLSARL